MASKEPIAALYSGGKDSSLALWRMQCEGHEVKCLLSVLPKNPDSFMYHKPDLKILKLQSKALGIPLLVEKTEGKKEKELAALKRLLSRAKKKFGVKGVVGGALYSNYQRERIQKICDALRLKLYSPLWHINQLTELYELTEKGFVFMMTKIAALGLDKGWLGKRIHEPEIAGLEKLQKKYGFNPAGEGGEYESLVLDAPNFRKKIVLEEFSVKMRNEFTGRLKIENAALESKKK